ncbi:MAG: hypothetical protein CSA66_02640 [Proteobacteria bacterium]|nr:MAG: hypothetical protein CSA66_02640 [Pseudomonadota bacterium]
MALVGLNSPSPVIGNMDRHSASLTVVEAALSGEVDGDVLRITLPLERLSSAAVRGDATVAMMRLDGTEIASATQGFDLHEARGEVTVDLPADALPDAGASEADVVVRWSIDAGTREVTGYKSLLYVMPKVDLRARLPDRMLVEAGAQVRVFAVDPVTNLPRSGVPVRLALYATDDQGEPTGEPLEVAGETDEDGSAVLPVPGQQEDGSYWFAAHAGGSFAMALTEGDVDVERAHRVLVTTDKPIYHPGQTMHIRALALRRPTLTAEGARPLTFEVYDGKGNMVFRKYAETNDFGVAAADFKLATLVNMGHYRIKAMVDGTATTKTVEVGRYTLPKFKVNVELDQPFYLIGDTIGGVVDARYFFGKPVRGSVSVKGTSFDVEAVELASASGALDEDGRFHFELQLPDYLVGQPLEGGHGLIGVTAEVTDGAGNTEDSELPVVVAKSPVDIVAVPESGGVVPGLDNLVYLFVTDPLNRPLDAALTVTVAGAEVAVENVGTGIARFGATPEDALSFHVVAETISETAEERFELTPGAADGGLLLRTERSLYRVGETVQLQVFSTGVGGRVFIDVVKDGQTMLTESLEAVDGVASKALDLDPGLVGDVLIEAYQVTADARIQRDKKLVFVQDARGLDVTVTADKATYRPGEEATLTFSVADPQGAPVVAALGVQIVDEAVFAVTDNKPGLLETYFLVQDALQEPRYQIDGFDLPLTPVVTGDPMDSVTQAQAEASFAALDTEAAAGFSSSWDQLKRAVPEVVAPRHAAVLDTIKETIKDLVRAGSLTEDNAAEALAGQSVFWDPWGNRYRFTTEEDWQGIRARVRSDGPDETADTWDDWSAEWYIVDYAIDEDFRQDAQNGTGGGMPEDIAPSDGGEEGGGVRVRKDFPETLYYNPALITGDDGEASVTLTMADSITEWRVSTLANTQAGALGSGTDAVVVFQEFFVDVAFPPTLTRNDQVSFPVSVYNYLETAQSVTVTLTEAPWFELLGPAQATLQLAAGEVTSVSFPVKVLEVGTHALRVTGTGTTMSDAVQRLVQVVPDGREVRESVGGVLEGTVTWEVAYPDTLIPNSHDLRLKIYPGVMAQAVEGLDSMLSMPSGCFEQTTATNWPNTLVLDYLRQSGQTSAEVELKALDFLQQGYQRLLTFECTGGGFVWFGDPAPANVVLSAMGVLELSDMARVIDVDPAVIERTISWIENAQGSDGSWHTDQGSEFATVQYDDVKTTAWTTWALAESTYDGPAVHAALTWLTPHVTDSGVDSYSLAMAANAFANAEPSGSTTQAVLNALADRAVTDEDGGVHWVYEGEGYNYGGGEVSGVSATAIEVTALAVQAFIAGNAHLDLVEDAIAWLAGNKDSLGNWGTTHATILTLRAMVRSLQNKVEEGEGTVTVSVGGVAAQTLAVTEENHNVFHQLALGDAVSLADANEVAVTYEGTGRLMYQLVWSYWQPAEVLAPAQSDVLDIDLSWDKTQLHVTDVATCTATVTNLTSAGLDMVMVDVGVPPGFTVLTDKLEAYKESGAIMRYELPGQQVTFYLDAIAPEATVRLAFDVQANYPVEAQATGSSAYLYYDTEEKAEADPVDFEVDD